MDNVEVKVIEYWGLWYMSTERHQLNYYHFMFNRKSCNFPNGQQWVELVLVGHVTTRHRHCLSLLSIAQFVAVCHSVYTALCSRRSAHTANKRTHTHTSTGEHKLFIDYAVAGIECVQPHLYVQRLSIGFNCAAQRQINRFSHTHIYVHFSKLFTALCNICCCITKFPRPVCFSICLFVSCLFICASVSQLSINFCLSALIWCLCSFMLVIGIYCAIVYHKTLFRQCFFSKSKQFKFYMLQVLAVRKNILFAYGFESLCVDLGNAVCVFVLCRKLVVPTFVRFW